MDGCLWTCHPAGRTTDGCGYPRSLQGCGQIVWMSRAFSHGLTDCLSAQTALPYRSSGTSTQIAGILKLERGEKEILSVALGYLEFIYRYPSSGELCPHGGWTISLVWWMNLHKIVPWVMSASWVSTCARHVWVLVLAILYDFHIQWAERLQHPQGNSGVP